MEGELAGMRLTERGERLHTAATRHTRHLANQTALADARWSYHADHSAVPVDGAVQQALDGGHLPAPTDQIRLSAPDRPILAHAQQAADRNVVIGTLDANRLRLTESRCAIN